MMIKHHPWLKKYYTITSFLFYEKEQENIPEGNNHDVNTCNGCDTNFRTNV